MAHAWKADLFTRADAHQNPPTEVPSISSSYNEVLRDAPVSDDVHRVFRGVCDTVLTQNEFALRASQSVFRDVGPCHWNTVPCGVVHSGTDFESDLRLRNGIRMKLVINPPGCGRVCLAWTMASN